ncbi:MAG: GNAT family acetyltransferase PA5433 [uncultured Thermomicrobiales bacterium]|uniref:GNAT family acetyltransferase PA5433 n=1 Tax=uncultured Thermomicrobiales bacterium TaxID=1645740 RepID=A0A6J4UGA3_9BACT|nr:MAG: GNAT family acetyltransferase PA5433 [uncultured Thermomicrobiales bacterium]
MDAAYRIGELVAAREIAPPRPTTIEGRSVRLVSLDPAAHAAALFDELQGPGADPLMWDYLGYGPFADVDTFTQTLNGFAASADPLWFAFVDAGTDQSVGMGGYLRIDRANRVIEIGHLCFGRSMQRATAATETIYLLIRHAFDLGYRRVEWKCNDLNERSKRAALRFGFTYEGTFRQHMIVRGRNRDTAWFAIVDGDWPAIQERFEAWLAPGNFDAAGQQRTRLHAPDT